MFFFFIEIKVFHLEVVVGSHTTLRKCLLNDLLVVKHFVVHHVEFLCIVSLPVLLFLVAIGAWWNSSESARTFGLFLLVTSTSGELAVSCGHVGIVRGAELGLALDMLLVFTAVSWLWRLEVSWALDFSLGMVVWWILTSAYSITIVSIRMLFLLLVLSAYHFTRRNPRSRDFGCFEATFVWSFNLGVGLH